MCTRWFLGEAGVELKRPGNAGFELQDVDIPHGQEDIINGDGPFFEVQHGTYIMQGLVGNSDFWFRFLGPPLEAEFQFCF